FEGLENAGGREVRPGAARAEVVLHGPYRPVRHEEARWWRRALRRGLQVAEEQVEPDRAADAGQERAPREPIRTHHRPPWARRARVSESATSRTSAANVGSPCS